MTTKPLDMTEELVAYVRAMQTKEPEILARLAEETSKDVKAHMRLGWEQGRFLMLLARLTQARRTLEIGVYTGYSALCVALALPPDGRITACDVSVPWTDVARRYWREAGVEQKVDLRIAPALDTLESLLDAGLAGTYDMAFIDADKGNYQNYFDKCLALVRPGGVVAVDNTLWYGRVVDPDNNDPETLAIRAFNERMRNDRRVDACLTAIGDGMTLAVKLG
ncbi:O-methyltransferase [Fundidesulfovibrio agrisoli]|uniref:O-methyltransferase n=1 Tax=Fundidesulfovibrio agrisoli TaxID=2922717 RepID=UPI001FAB5210|nr:class I SAM-dependent methyltransferase [Fundidesulfovibrio agrisoli]